MTKMTTEEMAMLQTLVDKRITTLRDAQAKAVMPNIVQAIQMHINRWGILKTKLVAFAHNGGYR